VQGDQLADAFVTVVSGLDGWKVPAVPETPVEVDQRGCIYEPRIHGVRVGQEVVFINSDPMFHNVRTESTANPPFNINMPAKDQRESKVFRRPERMVGARCDVHPWMVSHIGVVEHPWFAITDADGRFELPGLPPGTYELEVWHEVLGTKKAKATVSASGTARVEVVFDALPQE
jgi:plastocyanin